MARNKIRYIEFEFQFQIQFWKKLQNGGYRDLLNIKDIDGCWGIDNLDKFPMLTEQIDWYNQTFPEALEKCPKKVCATLILNNATFLIFFSSEIAVLRVSQCNLFNAF